MLHFKDQSLSVADVQTAAHQLRGDGDVLHSICLPSGLLETIKLINCGLSPFWGVCVPIGLVWSYDDTGPQLQGSLGSIGLRPMPPHCSRDPAHGPGVGLGLLPRLPPPTCARPVSGVGLGPRCYTASLLWSSGPRPSPVFRSAICDCLSLNVSVSLIPGRYEQNVNALGCALCLLTTTAIPRTGPMWARGFCPGSRRPRARVPLVVWAWDLFVMRLPCCGLPAPARPRFSLCDLRLFVINKRICSLVSVLLRRCVCLCLLGLGWTLSFAALGLVETWPFVINS